jgi:hypothetical protein
VVGSGGAVVVGGGGAGVGVVVVGASVVVFWGTVGGAGVTEGSVVTALVLPLVGSDDGEGARVGSSRVVSEAARAAQRARRMKIFILDDLTKLMTFE